MTVKAFSPEHSNQIAKEVIIYAAKALTIMADKLPESFEQVIRKILSIKGRVILIGMGKSGYIARKIASSLASTGTPAFFVHPGEASHGDLGMIAESDLVIMLSNSGETIELSDTINYCKRFNIPIVGITMKEKSTLAKSSSYLLLIPEYKEASAISAPTTSALLMLALGDAIVVALHEVKGISKDDYKIFHPGGKIGANLLRVKQLMHKDDKIPYVLDKTPLNEVIITITKKSFGCALVIKDQKLLGIITDENLREHLNSDIKNKTAAEVMTVNPLIIDEEMLASEALYIMNNSLITTLPVLSSDKVVGIIHIHDLLRAGVG